MKRLSTLLIFPVICFLTYNLIYAQNPLPTDNISTLLQNNGPRLFLNDDKLGELKIALQKDSMELRQLKQVADSILSLPFLKRELEGRRLLFISRAALKRLSTLSFIHHVTGDKKYHNRINSELLTICQFEDWNPSHFLDVAEMATAVAIAYDWGKDFLADSTKKMVEKKLLQAMKSSLVDNKNLNWWIDSDINWNQVCHGGLVLSAIAIFEKDTSLCRTIIERALKFIPIALKVYEPDGVYPEGVSYWTYGTAYTLLTIRAFQSAFGHDFELSKSKGLCKSIDFVNHMYGPSKQSYNFADAGNSKLDRVTQLLMNELDFLQPDSSSYQALNLSEAEGFDFKSTGHSGRFYSLLYLFHHLHQYPTNNTDLRTTQTDWSFFVGNGEIPVFSMESRKSSFYAAGKAGFGAYSHGHLDAGSFIIEWLGERWSIEMGMQAYHELEAIKGFNLWNYSKSSSRWTLLSKNNFGHSTLSINDSLHNPDGRAYWMDYQDNNEKAYVQMNWGNVFDNQLNNATRTFSFNKKSEIFTITDHWLKNPEAKHIQWQFITDADVILHTKRELHLLKNGKKIRLKITSPSGKQTFGIKSLDPPPLDYDKRMEGLKRIYIEISGSRLKKDNEISVEMSTLK